MSRRKAVLRAATLTAIVCIALLGACHPMEAADEAVPPAQSKAGQLSLTLTTEEIGKLGLVTTAARPVTLTPEVGGYGIVLPHDLIAQAVADVATAQAALQQSQAAMARVTDLASTPGAFSAEIQEAAVRQLATDEAALTLAHRKFSASFGEPASWQQQGTLNAVSSGDIKIVRATFPLGTLPGGLPSHLRMIPLDAGGAMHPHESSQVWPAPVDAAFPGRSVFATVKDQELSEGARVDVRATVGDPQPGAWVPGLALVIHENQYWCYVRKQDDTFERTPIDVSRPLDNGYFVTQAIAPGDEIVTVGAGLLLARQVNPATEAE